MNDPLLTHFDALDALLVALATDEQPVGWLWFRVVTDEMFRNECLERIGVS